MRKIRKNVFETNSSSVHSIVYSKDGLEPSYLPIKDEYVLADYGQFGRETRYYNDQESKLSYLLTLLYYTMRSEQEDVRENYYFEFLNDAICEYTGAKGIKILGEEEPYIDHQSVPDYGEIDIVDMYNKDEIINFIFNKDITLKTTSD